MIVTLLKYHFRRQILITSTQPSIQFSRFIFHRVAEIAELGISAVVDQDVLGLQVPVDVAFLVESADCEGDLDEIHVFCVYGHLPEMLGNLTIQISIRTVLQHNIHVLTVLKNIIQTNLPRRSHLLQHSDLVRYKIQFP